MDLAFRYPAYRRYWSARLVSSAGSAMAPVAMAFAVLHLGGTASALGWVLAAATVPQLLFTLVGGVVADRVSRARVLIWSSLVAAAGEGVFAVLVLAGVATVGQAVGAAFVTGTAAAFSVPAHQGAIRTLVPARLIGQATALQRVARNTTKVAGPALGGLLVSVVNPGWALAGNALSFVLAAAIIAKVPAPVAAPVPASVTALVPAPVTAPVTALVPASVTVPVTALAPASVTVPVTASVTAPVTASVAASVTAPVPRASTGDFRLGWREFWSRRWLRWITAQGSVGVGVWLVAFQLLGPVRAGPAAWGLIAAAFSAGLVAGSVVSVLRPPDRVGLVACANYAAAGLFPVALALGGGVPVLAVTAAVAGFCVDLALVSWSTYLQLSLPDEVHSRVESYNTLGHLIPVPIGYLAGGAAVDHLGVTAVAAGLAVLGALAAAVPLASPAVRELRIATAYTPARR
ncbi:MFS transporter [Actinoplanes sp. NPDC089786]|uniref:MFS transporter n=1 Tax=Actinoplanes sp. NPDC089786 TaxID=3155185 RepID=UPI00341EB1E8